MTQDEKEMGRKLVREVENRVVWLIGAAAAVIAGADHEIMADTVLDSYQTRFPPIDENLML